MMKRTIGGLLILLTVFMPVFAQQSDSGEPIVTDTSEVVEVQEVMYVTDKLRLSLYNKADSNSGIMKLLISGDELDVLEKTGPYSRVRTDDGLIGWVKNGFLVNSKTANVLLQEESKKNRELQVQLDKFANTEKLVEDYETTISNIQSDLKLLQQALDESTNENARLSESNNQLNTQLEQIRQVEPGGVSIVEIVELAKTNWYLIAGAAILLILIGILVGKAMVESQVKRRFQGVKVW